MTIEIKVDSFEELQVLAEKIVAGTKDKELDHKSLNEAAKETAEIINRAEAKIEKEEKKAEEKPAGEEKKVDIDELKAEVKKMLAAVNKKAKQNWAKEWINALGHENILEVNTEDELNQLKKLAEEVLNAE